MGDIYYEWITGKKEERMEDYSKTIFSQGIVCKNNNNNAYCVVIDGTKGTENDRSSMVLEIILSGCICIFLLPQDKESEVTP